VRRFNETFRTLFGRPPGALRRRSGSDTGSDTGSRDCITLQLAYRPPYDWPGMLAALHARAEPDIDWVEDGVWHRRVRFEGACGTVAVAHLPQRQSLLVTIRFPSVKALPAIVTRVRRVFDLGADIATIGSHLARDPRLAPLVARRPGLRAPGDWEHERMPVAGEDVPPAWRPWHAYAAQHLRMAGHG
jgi:AraC family transcriptional regulator of adaptative response / DNA-3-methyladenine glycosylase II